MAQVKARYAAPTRVLSADAYRPSSASTSNRVAAAIVHLKVRRGRPFRYSTMPVPNHQTKMV